MAACAAAASLVFGVAANLGACTASTLDAKGGEPRFDAAPFSLPTGVLCTFADAGLQSDGATFHELYTDYFGNPKGAACAGPSTGCHAAEGHTGAAASQYICPLDDAATCYDTMTGGSGLVAAAKDMGDPTGAYLYRKLRKAFDGGPTETPAMPLQPPCGFSADDMARITAWIARGAPND